MPYLKYYQKENERWPQLHASAANLNGSATFCEAEEAIRRWVLQYGKTQPQVVATRGRRSSSYNRSYHRIRLNTDSLDWLLVAHEMAHMLSSRAMVNGRKPQWHSPEHADFVDILCRWIIRDGWDKGNLAHELALKEAVEVERVQERQAACPPPIELRIQKREQQVKRLSTKIKMLGTRLKTANRSLAALRRSAAKAGGPSAD